jgi:hypothetical protein
VTVVVFRIPLIGVNAENLGTTLSSKDMVYRTQRFPFTGGKGVGYHEKLCSIAVEMYTEQYVNQPGTERFATLPCTPEDFILLYLDRSGDKVQISNDIELIEAIRDVSPVVYSNQQYCGDPRNNVYLRITAYKKK